MDNEVLRRFVLLLTRIEVVDQRLTDLPVHTDDTAVIHNKRHPNEMGTLEFTQVLSHLAVSEHAAATTQNQTLNTIA